MAVFTSKINDGYSAHLEVTQGAQNIGANSSTVNYKLYVTKASNYTGRYSPYKGRAYSVVVNGTTVENGTWTYDFRGKDSLTVVAGSTTVPHNSDGKKTVSASGSVYIFDVGTGRPSGSLTLTDIPRASTLTSFSNFDTNSANISFGLDKKYSGYTHDVVLKFGTTNIRTWTGQSLGATGNSVRTLALDGTDKSKLLARMASTTSGSVTLVVTTKNGTTAIGTAQRSATVSVDSSRVPTITNISVVAQTKAGRISGTAATYAVQNVGTIKCSYTATAGHSSSIRSAVIKANGSTFNSRDQTWTPSVAGSNTITIEVTDARGRVARDSRTVNVIPYQPISATLSSLTRRSDNKLSAVTNISNAPIKNGSTNMGRYRVRIYTTPTDKSAGRSNVYTKNHTGVGHTNFAETHIPTTIYDTHKSYDTEVVVEDDYSVVNLRGTLPTASYPFVMGRYGIGVGKIPEGSRVLDVGGQIWDHSSNASRNLSATVDALDVKYYTTDTSKSPADLLREIFNTLEINRPVMIDINRNGFHIYANGMRTASNHGFFISGSSLHRTMQHRNNAGNWTDEYIATSNDINLTSEIVKATDSPVATLHLFRSGRVIYFQCVTIINNGWSNLGITLPSEVRPPVNTPLSAGFSASGDKTAFGHAVVMASTGGIATLSSSEITNNVMLSGTWII